MNINQYNLIKELADKISENYYFSWSKNSHKFFNLINPDLWLKSEHNPLKFADILQKSYRKLKLSVAEDEILSAYNQYDLESKQYFDKPQKLQNDYNHPENIKIYYVSPEFAVSESFTNYAGGLGVLAGDYLKSASDLHCNIHGIGLLYSDGYFRQIITRKYQQCSKSFNNSAAYQYFHKPVFKNNPENLFTVKLNNSVIRFECLDLKIGNVTLSLINTNIKDNHNAFSTKNLYTGDRELRLIQEILLGQGSVMIAESFGIEDIILHINEGHAAFALIERVNLVAEKYKTGFDEALSRVITSSFFTTHTPVIHGNEEFDVELLRKHLESSSLLRYLSFDDFISLGRINGEPVFSMTAAAIRLSSKYNAVSKLHAVIATDIWKSVKPDIDFIPVTNGVHKDTWIAPEIDQLITYNSKKQKYNFINGDDINEKLIETKLNIKTRICEVFNKNHFFNKSSMLAGLYKNVSISPDDFVIGFARRFAEYKRGDLIFYDIENLIKLFEDYPQIKFIFSGKAHPKDVEGKAILKNIIMKINDYHLQNNIIFIENYDMMKARFIIQLSDLWLNNPVRGLEACGTSGMKAAMNGALNCSIPDGWWDEAYNPEIGWAIGDRESKQPGEMELSKNILELIKNDIIQKFINNRTDLWANMMKTSILTALNDYSSGRMLIDYYKNFYKNSI